VRKLIDSLYSLIIAFLILAWGLYDLDALFIGATVVLYLAYVGISDYCNWRRHRRDAVGPVMVFSFMLTPEQIAKVAQQVCRGAAAPGAQRQIQAPQRTQEAGRGRVADQEKDGRQS